MSQMPVLYLPHGGGPLPLLGDPKHASLTEFLINVGEELPKPKSILIISAHWEEDTPTVTSGKNPELIYDYYGFPEESYEIQYPAPGLPVLSEKIKELLEAKGLDCVQNSERGFDHGMFVPLKLMYPGADIPCVQLSLVKGLSPKQHIEIGKSLEPLRKEGVLIIGSGLSFHNMQAFFSSAQPEKASRFDQWLVETCCKPELTIVERENRLIEWENAPQARFCHPREEHLLPLHVCFGASQGQSPVADLVFHKELMGYQVSAFLWR